MDSQKSWKSPVVWGPVSLVAGFVFGALLQQQGLSSASWVGVLGEIGTLWVNALRIVVVPLAALLLFSGVAQIPSRKAFGKWGTVTALTLFGLLLAATIFTLLASYGLLGFLKPQSAVTASEGTPVTQATGGWIESLLPSNFFEALVRGDMLAILLVALLFGLALRSLGEKQRDAVLPFFNAIRDAAMVYVGWVIAVMPIGAFCLSLKFAAESGFAIAASILQFVLLAHVLLAGFLLLLYLGTAILGKVSIPQFASAVWPAQQIAIGTRSSVATLPSLIQSSDRLRLPEESSSFVLPFAAAVLKINRPITSISKLIFVAAVYGVVLTPEKVGAFILTVWLISIATPGIPSANSAKTFGAYVAAGIPPEGAALFEASNPLTDIGKTIVNATGYFSAALIASRFAAKRVPDRATEPPAEPAAARA